MRPFASSPGCCLPKHPIARGVGALAVTILTLAAPQARATQTPAFPPLPVLLDRAAAYVDQYERRFSAVMSEETYRQTANIRSGALVTNRYRVTRSQVLMVNAGADNWLWFRDVLEVDGSPLRDHVARLEALFQKPASASAQALSEANRIAEASAKYNLGPVRRNVNVPTMALSYLRWTQRARSSFREDHVDKVGGDQAEVVTFVETKRPTIVRGAGNADIPAKGKFWIDASGRVDRTELSLSDGASNLRASIDVTYGPQPKVAVWVPVKMREHYDMGHGQMITTEASYSHYQKVVVTVDVKIKHGGGV